MYLENRFKIPMNGLVKSFPPLNPKAFASMNQGKLITSAGSLAKACHDNLPSTLSW
jgi:hypothetical protein